MVKRTGVLHEDRVYTAYQLDKGARDYVVEGIYGDLDNYQSASNSKVHDVELLNVVYELSRFIDLNNFVTENELFCMEAIDPCQVSLEAKAFGCDGLIKHQFDQKKTFIVLEYERSVKAKSRLASKILNYALSSKIDKIIYIYKSEYVGNVLRKIVLNLPKDEISKFSVCSFKTLEKSSSLPELIKMKA